MAELKIKLPAEERIRVTGKKQTAAIAPMARSIQSGSAVSCLPKSINEVMTELDSRTINVHRLNYLKARIAKSLSDQERNAPYLTVQAVAQLLELRPGTVRTAIDAGKIDAFRLG